MKFKFIIVITGLWTQSFCQDKLLLTRTGLNYFVAGNFEKSIQMFSEAIKQDSTIYENYYFRAIALTYTIKDTLSFDDFFKSLYFKRQYTRQADTVLLSSFLLKPVRKSTLGGPALLHDQSELFFDMMLATWYLLNNKNNDACLLLNNTKLKKLNKVKKFRKKYCP